MFLLDDELLPAEELLPILEEFLCVEELGVLVDDWRVRVLFVLVEELGVLVDD